MATEDTNQDPLLQNLGDLLGDVPVEPQLAPNGGVERNPLLPAETQEQPQEERLVDEPNALEGKVQEMLKSDSFFEKRLGAVADFELSALNGLVKGIRNPINTVTSVFGQKLPEVSFYDDSQTLGGTVGSVVGQVVPSLLAVTKGLSLLGKGSGSIGGFLAKNPKTTDLLLTGPITSGLAFEGEEGLLNLVAKIPGLEGLAITEDDSLLEQKGKQALDAFVAGAVGVPLGMAARFIGSKTASSGAKVFGKVLKTKTALKGLKGVKDVADIINKEGIDELDLHEFYKAVNLDADDALSKAVGKKVVPLVGIDDTLEKTLSQGQTVSDDILKLAKDLQDAHPGKIKSFIGNSKLDLADVNTFNDTREFLKAFDKLLEDKIQMDPRLLKSIRTNPKPFYKEVQRSLDLNEEEFTGYLIANGKTAEERLKWVYKTYVSGNVLGKNVKSQAAKILEYKANGQSVPKELIAKYKLASEQMVALQPTYKQLARSSSDGLALHQDIPRGWERGKKAQEVLKKIIDAGDDEEAIIQAALFTNSFDDPMDALAYNSALYNKGPGRLTREAISEVYLNSLLYSPKTLGINTINGLMMGVFRPLEETTGAIIDSALPIRKLLPKSVRDTFAVAESSLGKQPSFIKGSSDVIRNRVSYLGSMMGTLDDSTKAAYSVAKSYFSDEGVKPLFTPSQIGLFQKPKSVWSEISKRIDQKFIGDSVQKKMATGALWIVDKLVNLPRGAMAFSDEFIKQVVGRSQITGDIASAGYEQGLKGVDFTDFRSRTLSKVIDENTKQLRDRKGNLLARASAKSLEKGYKGETKNRFLKIASKLSEESDRLQEMTSRAKARAEVSTFQSLSYRDGLTGKLLELGDKAVELVPELSLFIPFRKTPFQIGREGLERIPGLGLLVNKNLKRIMSSNPEARAEALGKQAVGSLAALTGAALGLIGEGRGSFVEVDEEGQTLSPSMKMKQLRGAGEAEQSVTIGGKSVQIRGLAPYNGVFGTFADISRLLSSGTKEGFEAGELALHAFSVAIMENADSRDLLQGLAGMMEYVFNPSSRVAEPIAGSLAKGFIPSWIRQMSRLMDEPVMREARSMVDRMIGELPGLKAINPVLRDGFGRPVRDPMNSTLQVYNPFSTIEKQVDPLLEEQIRLNYFPRPYKTNLMGLKGFDLTKMKVEGTNYTYYDEAAELMGTVEVGGKTLPEAALKLINSSSYKRLKVDKDLFTGVHPQVQELQKLRSKYAEQVDREMERRHPELRDIEKKSKARDKLSDRRRPEQRDSLTNELKDIRRKLKGDN